MTGVELHLPTDFKLVDHKGEPVSLAKLTDWQCWKLSQQFYALLLEQRDLARLH